jgi:hydroxyacylglutathione hydrolase
MERAQKDSCTTGKSTIGDEKKWNVFMRLDTPEAK